MMRPQTCAELFLEWVTLKIQLKELLIMMKAIQCAMFYMLYLICMLGAAPVAALAQPYVISPDDNEVADQKTGLIWLRCAAGMVYNGSTCTGTASTFTHEAAVQYATDYASNTGIAWRLPNIKEIASIADKSRINPAIDLEIFPATPADKFWSASPCVSHPGVHGHSGNFWFVAFRTGFVGDDYAIRSNHVRLVRDVQ